MADDKTKGGVLRPAGQTSGNVVSPANKNGSDDGGDDENWYGGSGSGGSGGGGGGDISDEEQQAFDNLGGIVGFNQDTLTGADENANRVYDVADEQSENLWKAQTKQNRRQAGNDWFTNQQNLQAVTDALRDRSGNAMNGSYLYDLWDLVARKDDQDDAAVLDAMRENQDQLNASYFEALASNNNGRNEQAMKTESSLRELASDYVAQGNNINPELVEDYIDAENHDLDIPDWLTIDWFDDHLREALEPEEQGFYRPDDAAEEARRKGLLKPVRNTASSANRSYRDKLFGAYSRRNQ